ncbi:hypothetical protein [Paracoccus methylarcula]|uniref:Uncharacterized protein n=1 Tax=Paracoccus methylarcula TaxID=72022 RepID=A0A3R7LQZ3_9RHOB|nr:hypothetical protein [Paracoccus methylarcula]RNF35772.1 hypothetical protein A7A09_005180 [Paracoccus methylarcula]
MRQSPCLAALPLIFLSSAALADCTEQTLISCDTGNGNHLEACIEAGVSPDGARFTYAFGPRDKPKLTLREELAAGTATPWSGVGRAIWESVAFRHEGHVYEVWHSFDRLEQVASLEGGVNVLRGEELLVSLSCQPGPGTVIAPLFTIGDAMAEAGFCRDPDLHEWRRGDCG